MGGGFAGVEAVGELLLPAVAMAMFYPELSTDDVSFTLIEAPDRNLPEVGDKSGGGRQGRCASAGAATKRARGMSGGATVLSAAEISFVHEAARRAVSEVGNRSSGYCPLQPCGTADVTRPVHARSKD
ncbi:hypothetical protein ACGFZQ_12600 [Streptomyces sp. NPDC048254]|uniref:hypothetical protein n=1 Tax=Streptomyces sp. NPDC048254 TaxID=3365525 RepID=UPI00371637CB